LVERGGYVYRSADHVNESRLLGAGGPTHIEYRDRRYRVEVSVETFYDPIYRADVDPVAGSEAEMEAVLRAALVTARLELDSLTEAERRIIRRATGAGYDETHPFSEPLESVLKALDRRAYLDGDIENDGGLSRDRSAIVLYGAEYYDLHVWLEG
jgi:hypothetical protein